MLLRKFIKEWCQVILPTARKAEVVFITSGASITASHLNKIVSTGLGGSASRIWKALGCASNCIIVFISQLFLTSFSFHSSLTQQERWGEGIGCHQNKPSKAVTGQRLQSLGNASSLVSRSPRSTLVGLSTTTRTSNFVYIFNVILLIYCIWFLVSLLFFVLWTQGSWLEWLVRQSLDFNVLCQPHWVTSGQSNLGYKQMHILKLLNTCK